LHLILESAGISHVRSLAQTLPYYIMVKEHNARLKQDKYYG
jgi:hypothetical protein